VSENGCPEEATPVAVELEEGPSPRAELEIVLLPAEFGWRLRDRLRRLRRARRYRDGPGPAGSK
jgi:hypothetical protein